MTVLDEVPAATAQADPSPTLTITGLRPLPADVWKTMLRFSGPDASELHAMRQTIDILFQRGYQMIVSTYDYLRSVPETAEILGWEDGIDEAHLAERRRFQTMWLARTLSIDLGTDFARYLFRAGQIHTGHGPRHIHVPVMWVAGTVSLTLAAFAQAIQEAHTDVAVVAPALSGWNKYLMIQHNQMQAGYETGVLLDAGDQEICIRAFGRAREQWGRSDIFIHYYQGMRVSDILRKLTDYAPTLREMLFEQTWDTDHVDNDLWMRVVPVYRLRENWRVLLNGQDLRYYGGFDRVVQSGDELDLFPPGR